MNTADVNSALRERYPAPEWSIFFEVANGTGSHSRRYADAVAMNLFPSRGLEINGFEVKVSRSDWLRELKKPAKAEDIYRYCHRWWLVVTPGVIKEGELPVTWGLIEAKDGKLRQVTAAPLLQPADLDRAFVAALIRRAGQTDADSLRVEVAKQTADIRRIAQAQANCELEYKKREYDQLKEKLEKIKNLTGIDLTKWTPTEDIAQALRMVMAADIDSTYGGIRQLQQSARAFAKRIDEAMSILEPGPVVPFENKEAA